MKTIRLTRSVKMPDPVRISRYRRSPELGPALLFFSGGSALNEISRILKGYTHNSIHLVTPFDSGGSSAKLRQAFDMPSIGDLRSRMIALADETVTGHPDVYELFTYRLPVNLSQQALRQRIDKMIAGRHPLVDAISNPMRRLIRNQLGYFREQMPEDFNLQGASIGNLILTGGYLNNHHHLDPIIFLFSKLVGVRGIVRAVVNDNLHISAELADGRSIAGQHLMTGKEVDPLDARITGLSLVEHPDNPAPAKSVMRKKNRKLINSAELICFPPGSFHTSLIANLLPRGVADAIQDNDCPKVYIPNLGRDPEQIGMTLDDCVRTLHGYLHRGLTDTTRHGRLLDFILLDSRNGDYPGALSPVLLEEMGVDVIDTRLVSRNSAPYYDPELLVSALLSLT